MFSNILELADALTAPEGGLSFNQRTALKAYAGMPLDREETAIWRRATGRTGLSAWIRSYKAVRASEWWLLAGRRSGKTTIGSICTIWESTRRQAPANQAWQIPIICPGLRQGQKISLDYIRRKVLALPELAQFLVGETQDSLTFSTGITVRTLPPDPRLCQGFTAPFIWLDEASGFRDESAFSNLEDVLDAVRPSIATIADGRVLVTSLPGPKTGLLYETWNSRFNLPGALVWRSSSIDMNPSLAGSTEIEKARKRVEHWKMFYSGEFIDARSALLPADLVDAAIAPNRPEFSPAEVRGNAAGGCDFAASGDDCAAAIAIRMPDDKIVVPWVRCWSVKSGELHPVYSYFGEIAEAFKAFEVRKAVGDQQSLAAATQFFTERGVGYERLVTNGQASEPVFDFLREQLGAGRVALPDNDVLRNQLKRLEERRDKNYEVAASKGKDDLAVAVAAAIYRAGQLPLPGREPQCGAVWAGQPCGTDPDRHDRFFRRINPNTPSFSRPRF